MGKLTETLQSVICIVFFTYFGVLVRLALTLLSDTATGTLLPQLGSGFLLANIYGSFIMGIFVVLVDYFRGRTYWHVGVTSGFCGSCTTFATWQKVTANLMITRHILDSFIISLLTFSTSYMALLCGRHLGEFLASILHRIKPPKTYAEDQMILDSPPPKETKTRTFNVDVMLVLVLVILITVGLWMGIFMDNMPWRRDWWVAMALGPVGSLIRYLTSLYNNNFPKFPAFTFLVNISGSVIAMLFLVIDHFLTSSTQSSGVTNAFQFWAIDGVGTGLLGSLSTVSTFVNELYKFRATNNTGHAYRYGLATFLVAQVLCVLVGAVTFFH